MPPTDQLRRCAEYAASQLPQAREIGCFRMHVGEPTADSNLERYMLALGGTFKSEYARTVRGLLAKAEMIRLYGVEHAIAPAIPRPEPEDRAGGWLHRYTRKARGTTEIVLSAEGILDDVDFWWWLIGAGATVAGVIPSDRLDPSVDFAAFQDPVVISNSWSSTPRPARTFTTKAADRGTHTGFIATRAASRSHVNVVSSPDAIEELFEASLAHGTLTEKFIRSNATYHVLPFELTDYTVWIRLNSNGNDWTILDAAIALAQRNGSSDDFALLNGLVAAELVAALFGHPPASYGTLNERRAAALAAWVERIAPTRPLSPEVRQRALAFVSAVAATSTLPEERWRTEEPRALWRSAIADLERRLST